MTEEWDISSGASKFSWEEDADTWFGPIAGWAEDKCKTGFQSQMLYIDDEGYSKNFTKKTVEIEGDTKTAYYYQIKDDDLKPLNRFRIYVETLSGPDGGETVDEVFGQTDQVHVMMRQLNTPYISNLCLQILSEAEDPAALLENQDLFVETLMADPRFDMSRIYSVVWSRTVVTGTDGNTSIDVDIPDPWDRGLVYVQVIYGYDAAAERDTMEKSIAFREELAWEVVALVVGVVLLFIPIIGPILTTYWISSFVVLVTLEMAIFGYFMLAGLSPAGNNRYDCSFPFIDLEDLGGQTGDEMQMGFMHNYMIQLGDEEIETPPAPDMDADWITQLEENQKMRKKNAYIWLGSIGVTFITAVLVASSMGGDEDD